ncbi:alpha/beta hydrolase [Acetobacteraceae bacterium]|nr:alpha/beta hydrolase [Candidatus Parcubacteria bacterium]
MKAILIPGNGGSTPESNWLPYVKKQLEKLGIPTTNVQFPDPVMAREEYWLPFIKELGADEETILIGHSSGAVAAMRYAERHKILGSVLVGACYTDLGEESERISGYFKNPWNWDTIKKNQKWIIQFASTDDPFIPLEQPHYIKENLETEYHEFTDQGHFGGDKDKLDFPELIEAIKAKL